MSSTQRQDIVVALDGSERSLVAVRWAALQSQMTGDRLVVLHAFEVADQDTDPRQLRAATESVHRTQATAWLRRALGDSPAMPYSTRLEVVEGPWLSVLRRRAARAASLLVLGVDGGRAPDVRGIGVPVVLVPARFAAEPGQPPRTLSDDAPPLAPALA